MVSWNINLTNFGLHEDSTPTPCDSTRTIRRIFKENYINPKQHFYKHI